MGRGRRFLDCRQHRDGSGGGVDAPLRFGFRHALHAMRAGFVLELRINAEADDARNDFLEAAVLTFVGGQDFDLPATRFRVLAVHARSEEHTSELQSLMRISYAVFCLKKKKMKSTYHTHN